MQRAMTKGSGRPGETRQLDSICDDHPPPTGYQCGLTKVDRCTKLFESRPNRTVYFQPSSVVNTLERALQKRASELNVSTLPRALAVRAEKRSPDKRDKQRDVLPCPPCCRPVESPVVWIVVKQEDLDEEARPERHHLAGHPRTSLLEVHRHNLTTQLDHRGLEKSTRSSKGRQGQAWPDGQAREGIGRGPAGW